MDSPYTINPLKFIFISSIIYLMGKSCNPKKKNGKKNAKQKNAKKAKKT